MENCEGGNGHVEESGPQSDEAEDTPPQTAWHVVKSTFGAGCVTLWSIPALIGSGCWPAVLSGLLGDSFSHLDTHEHRRLAHTLSWGLTLAATAAMLTFVAAKTPGKRGHLPTSLERWSPLLVLLLGASLVMLDPTRHILLDNKIGIPALLMFNKDGTLSLAGRTGQLGAWVGNALLAAGLIWFVWPVKRAMKPARRAFTSTSSSSNGYNQI